MRRLLTAVAAAGLAGCCFMAGARRGREALIPLGPTFAGDVAAELSHNGVGRVVLEAFQTPAGPVLPDFFLSPQRETQAWYDPLHDEVALAERRIAERGGSLSAVSGSREAQRRLIHDLAPTLVHELVHAQQARRRPAWSRWFGLHINMEREYEAHLTERLYIHEELKADPRARLTPVQLAIYESFLDDLDGSLASLDKLSAYRGLAHEDSPRYKRFMAGLRKRWPTLRKEGYGLLARRFAASRPQLAQAFTEKEAAVTMVSAGAAGVAASRARRVPR